MQSFPKAVKKRDTERNVMEYRAKSDEEVAEFYELLSSDESEAMKADAIAGEWTHYCQTQEDVETIFLSCDVLQYLERATGDRNSLVRFVCFAIIRSPKIREYVTKVLLYEGGIYANFGILETRDSLMILTACSLTTLSNGEIRRTLDYIFSVPCELISEALVALKIVSYSLPFVNKKHVIRVANMLNMFVSRLNEDGEVKKNGDIITQTAKRVARAVEHQCFDMKIWRPFLRAIDREYELVTICKCPVLIDEPCELPYKKKLQLRGLR